jgi:hypothetical protein
MHRPPHKPPHTLLRKTRRNRRNRKTHKGMVFSNIYGWRKIKNLKTRKH